MVFEVYPEAIATLPGSQIWSFLFFITLIMVGMDSAVREDFPSNMRQINERINLPPKSAKTLYMIEVLKSVIFVDNRNLDRTKTNHHNQVRVGKVPKAYEGKWYPRGSKIGKK